MKLHKVLLNISVVCLLVIACNALNSRAVERMSALSAEPVIKGSDYLAVPAPWKEWIDVPSALGIGFSASVTALSNSTVNVSIGPVGIVANGLSCSSSSNSPAGFATVRLYQPVTLTVSATNAKAITVTLTPPQLHNLDLAKNRRGAPPRFRLYVNGIETNTVALSAASCGALSTNCVLEVRPDREQQQAPSIVRDDPRDLPEDAAPGDGDWLRLGPGKSSLTNVAIVKWCVGIGRLLSGKSAGRLHLFEFGLTPDVCTPPGLFFNQLFALTNQSDPQWGQLEVLTNNIVTNRYVIRQIKAPQTLVDVSWDAANTNGYDLRFFPPSAIGSFNSTSNCYDLNSSTPFVIWRITNSSPTSTFTRLQILEMRPERTYTNDLTFDGTNKWTLTRGEGTEQRIETRTIVFDAGDRLETNVIKNGSGALAYSTTERYRAFPWGWELVSVRTSTGSEELLQSFEYYTNSAAPTDFGRIQWITYPDGHWEKRLYHNGAANAYGGLADRARDGEIAYILTPWNNTLSQPDTATISNSHSVQYSYASDPNRTWTYLRLRGPNPDSTTEYQGSEEFFWFDPTLKLIKQTHTYLLCHFTHDVEQGTTRFVDWGMSVNCGQIAHTLTGFGISSTNTFEYGSYTNGGFITNAGSAWKQVTLRGPGYIWNSAEFSADRCTVIAGKSTKEYLVRAEATAVLRENYVATGATTFALVESLYFANDLLGRWTNQTRVDGSTSASRVNATRDWQGTNSLPTQLLLSETDETGATRKYTYDSLKRIKTVESVGVGSQGVFPAQVSITTTFYYDAMNRLLRSDTNASGTALKNAFVYDLAGRLAFKTNEADLVTSYTYGEGGRVTAVTHPSGGTLILSNYLSRKPWSETGTAVIPAFHDYSYASVFHCVEEFYIPTWSEQTTIGSPLSGRFQEIQQNTVGWKIYEIQSAFSGAITNSYVYLRRTEAEEFVDKLVGEVRRPGPSGGQTISEFFTYDELRNVRDRWTCGPGGCGSTTTNPAYASQDRLTSTDTVFEDSGSGIFRTTAVKAYTLSNNATPAILQITRERFSGFSSSVLREVATIDFDLRTNIQTTFVDSSAKKVTITTSDSTSSLIATQIWINGVLQSESSLTVASPTQYRYDNLRRLTQTVNPRGASAFTTYDPATGQVESMRDFAANVTQYEYYANGQTGAGMIKSQTRADGKKAYFSYTARGELTRTWGDVPYPEERIYNEFGEMTELRTYRGGSGWTANTWPASPGTADATVWNYHGPSAWLLSKTDPQSQAVTYKYWTNGLLGSMAWSRGVTNYYSYYDQGDLRLVHQDTRFVPEADGLCVLPSFGDKLHRLVSFSDYNRLGSPIRITEYDTPNDVISGSCITTDLSLRYDPIGRLIAELWIAGPLSGVIVSNSYSSRGRDSVVAVRSGSSLISSSYGFDAFGRMGSVTSGLAVATYAYQPNSDLLQSTTSKHNGSTVLTTGRTWDTANRLQSIANLIGFSPVTSHAYLYDAANRRTQATLEDGSRWKYEYNDRDEVISGKRSWTDWSPVSGQQFTYNYDNIGNRTNSASGGDTGGANLRNTSYTVNNLNEYTTVTTPGYKDIIGAALAYTNVTVDSGACDRKGEYFHREISVANSSGPGWQNTTVISGGTSNTGGFVFPKNSQTLTYDLDGNLTFDGVWAYRWDNDNRLVEMVMTNVVSVPNSVRTRIQFTNDFMGRRISKTVFTWNGSAFASPVITQFVYDGWKLLAELDSSGNAVRTYTCGLDLSGTQHGAGGIGGLLVVRDASSGTNHFVGYDGNGNVTGLVAQNGAISAQYEYGPFGEALRATGFYSRSNPMRWSTKFFDEESGLSYYGLRYHSANLGRWVSRDPMEEEGGKNLYVFTLNSPIAVIDPDGAAPKKASALVAIVDAVIELARASAGEAPSRSGSPALQAAKLQQELQKAKTAIVSVVSGAGAGGKPPPEFYRHTGGWDFKGRALGAVLGTLGTATYFLGGQAEADAASFASNAADYARNRAGGESAWADLDAAMLAIDLINITGSSVVGLTVWSALQDE